MDFEPFVYLAGDFDEEPIDLSSSHVSGIPLGAHGITGHIPRNLREVLRKIYDAFWINEFTCNDIQNKYGLKNLKFKCTTLRTFRNYGAVTSTIKRVERGGKPVRVWKLTSETINYFATH